MLQLRKGDKVFFTDVFPRQPGQTSPSQEDIDREVELLFVQFGQGNATFIPFSVETLPYRDDREKFRIWIISRQS